MSQKIRYQVGQHILEVAANEGRWTAAVDGAALEQWFMSLADAWTAGVTEAGRLDQCTEASRRHGGRQAPSPESVDRSTP